MGARHLPHLAACSHHATTPRPRPQGFKLLHQLALLVKVGEIPRECVVNMDQTGMRLVPIGNRTRVSRGARDVPMLGQDDKRMITIVPAITVAGALGGCNYANCSS